MLKAVHAIEKLCHGRNDTMPFPFRAILKYPPPIIILLLAPTLPLFGQPHYVAPGCNDGNHGTLKSCEGKVPTPPGPVLVSWENGDTFKLSLTLPAGMSAQAQLPADKKFNRRVPRRTARPRAPRWPVVDSRPGCHRDGGD